MILKRLILADPLSVYPFSIRICRSHIDGLLCKREAAVENKREMDNEKKIFLHFLPGIALILVIFGLPFAS